MNSKKVNRHYVIWLITLVLLCSVKIQAQQFVIEGPATVNYGDIVSYTLKDSSGPYGNLVGDFGEFWWGGDVFILNNDYGNETTINASWNINIEKNIWLSVSFYDINANQYYYVETFVTVLPNEPTTPTVLSTSCNEVVLQRGTPPDLSVPSGYNPDVRWYWQSTADGTSTANSNSTISLTSGNQYFLRAKSIVDYGEDYGTWSATSSSVAYTIGNPAPTVGTITQPTMSTPTGSVVLSGLPSTGTWVINPGNISGTGTTTTITGLAASSTYNFTVTTSGCTSGASANVVINAQSSGLNAPILSAVTQPTSTTSTGSFTITNYNASYTYAASPSVGVSFSGATVTAPQGSYTITATSGGNSSSPSAIITVNAQPIICGGISNENYIHTIAPQIETTDVTTLTTAQKAESVTYFDGLGRPMQSIAMRAGGNNQDIITHIGYDDFGRQDKEYLPYTDAGSCGVFRTGDVELATKTFYNIPKYENTLNPYSEKNIEASPLNRVLKQAAPGNDWILGNGHEIKLDYQSNTGASVGEDQVKNFGVSLAFASNTYTPTLTQSAVNNGFYNASELYKTITFDENTAAVSTELNGSTVEFKNKQGQVVLKRTYGTVGTGSTNEKYDTYYVYDDYGNLTFVIPPKASDVINTSTATVLSNTSSTAVVTSGNSLALTASNSIILLPGFQAQAGSTFTATIGSGSNPTLDELCYQYKYDYRNRLVEKKLPGKQWEFILYDKLDRVVATGPALSPFNDTAIGAVGWLITKYDVFSRSVYTGWEQSTTVNSAGRIVKQNALNSATTFNESKQTSGTIDGIAVYYTNTVTPTSFKLLTVNYYDNYTFPSVATIPTTVESQTILATAEVKGLATGSWTRIPTSSASIVGEIATIFYDKKARPIRMYTQNFLGGYTYSDSKLDFTGKPDYSITYHKRVASSTELRTKDAFTYSPQGRLLVQTHQINGGTVETIASNSYDELGQLISKEVGGNTQKIDYTYNIRGWLKGINNIGALQQGTDPKDLFAFAINYNTTSIAGIKPLYNGNIAETYWTSNSDPLAPVRAYGYEYDNLNRLKSAVYQKSGFITNMYNENMDYDKNGNIMHLTRFGSLNDVAQTQIDNLTYNYLNNNTTNQLISVDDAITNNSNFINEFKNTAGTDYSYDANGNMLKDLNKGIGTSTTDGITYNHLNLPTKITFGSAGNIVYIYNAVGQKVQKVVTQGATTTTTDYLGGYQYKNAGLKFFPTAEGYVEPSTSSYKYVYQYKDHLGNVRLGYDKTLAVQEENDYYPFGLKHTGYGYSQVVNSDYKYKYNGKELQDELGLNMEAMDWRQYDPAIGRFVVIDPAAEFQRKWSPYHFSFDNPVLYNDPSGLEGEEVTKKKKGKPGDPDNPIPLQEVVVKGHKKSTTSSSVVNFLWASVDYVPFAGSIKQIGVGIYEGNMTDVALGTVFLAVDIFTAGEGGAALRLAEVATEDALKIAAKDEAKELVEHNLDEIGEGIYEFKYLDEAGEVKDYTGQSKNVEKRLSQHTNGGKKVPIEGTVNKTSVKGGKTAREVFETKTLKAKGGPGGTNGNKVWPVSAKREAFLKTKGLW